MTVLCLSSYFKGEAFLSAAKAAGAHVILITSETLSDAAWPWGDIDQVFYMPTGDNGHLTDGV